MEQQARTAVRGHQGIGARCRTVRGPRGGDRGSHRQQAARPGRGGEVVVEVEVRRVEVEVVGLEVEVQEQLVEVEVVGREDEVEEQLDEVEVVGREDEVEEQLDDVEVVLVEVEVEGKLVEVEVDGFEEEEQSVE